MADDDLIRRGDAHAVVRQTLVDAAHRNAGKSGNWPSAFFKAEEYASVAIAALPAVEVQNDAYAQRDLMIRANGLLGQEVEKLTALLKEARQDLEAYITNEYPKDQHPYYERQWNRDMELCRRIDAALEEVKDDPAA